MDNYEERIKHYVYIYIVVFDVVYLRLHALISNRLFINRHGFFSLCFIKYTPKNQQTSKQKNRNRNIICYNPPFHIQVSTNI